MSHQHRKLPVLDLDDNGRRRCQRVISSTHSADGDKDVEGQQRQREWQLDETAEHHSKKWSGRLVGSRRSWTMTVNTMKKNCDKDDGG